MPVAVELEAGAVEQRRDRLFEAALHDALGGPDVPTVGDVMSADALVVAPEDTLGEVAEKMHERDVGSALVADHGRLIGILTSRDIFARSLAACTRARPAHANG